MAKSWCLLQQLLCSFSAIALHSSVSDRNFPWGVSFHSLKRLFRTRCAAESKSHRLCLALPRQTADDVGRKSLEAPSLRCTNDCIWSCCSTRGGEQGMRRISPSRHIVLCTFIDRGKSNNFTEKLVRPQFWDVFGFKEKWIIFLSIMHWN